MPNALSHAAAAAAAAALLTSLAAPSAAGTAPAAAHTTAASGPAKVTAAVAPLTLISGDRLLVEPGAGTVGVQPRKGLGGILFSFVGCGQSMRVPATALPYLGRGLDPSLFELTALERAERNGRLPVRVSFHGRVPPLPGVRITRSGPGLAEGYLTPASAARFGAALGRQFLADHARGSYGSDGLFADGVSIALPGPPGAGPATASFPMHTLTVKGTSLAGKPDTGDDVLVFNADNCARLGAASTASTFYHGAAKYSVPAGNYWAIGQFFSFSANGPALRLAVLPQFSVHRSTTVSVSARSATSKITMTTPRPAATRELSFGLVRTSPSSVLSAAWISLGYSIWVSPVRTAHSTGTLQAYTSAQLTSPPGAGIPYAYALNFVAPPGTIPAQHHVVRQSDLATVSDHFYQDLGSDGAWLTTGGTARQLALGENGGATIPLRLPTRVVQYLSARPATFWQTQYWESHRALAGGQTGAFRLLHAGEHVTETWNRYPLHPGVTTIIRSADVLPAALLVTLPSAARAGNTLRLDITPFSDSQAGHLGTGFSPGIFGSLGPVSGGYTLYQNGVKIASGSAVTGDQPLLVRARLNPGPSLIKFVATASRAGKHYRLSASSRDVWSWHSRPEPGATVPPPWSCTASLGPPDRHCAVQPMMTLDYRVAGLSLTGTTSPGHQALTITAGHIQLARPAPVTGTTAQVSFNDGKTWRQAHVRRTGAGRFRATFTAPQSHAVTLRVTARDASGASLTETIARAYRTSASAAPRHARAAAPGGTQPRRMRAACPAAAPGYERCFALFQPQVAVNRAIAAGISGPAAQPRGWSPQAIQAAYRLPTSRDSHQTVAVSIAFDTPKLARFLAVYRRHYGLPPCTTLSGCLHIVNQRGKRSPLPTSGVGSGWDLEATLDVSMISAACPHCHILVVEGNDPSFASLGATEDTAAALGAAVISNSYGARESGFSQAAAPAYDHPGHTIVASSGDEGFGAAQFPASLATVTAVGGTTLARARGARGFTETTWHQHFTGTGSGCSAYVAKPAWQHDPHCPGRTSADVAAVATGIPIYTKTYGGWVSVAGTSISAPLIGGIYGLAGNASDVGGPHYLYQHRGHLFDITTGNNALFATPGATCGNDYLCTAKKGYDAPTGLGTPDGTGAF